MRFSSLPRNILFPAMVFAVVLVLFATLPFDAFAACLAMASLITCTAHIFGERARARKTPAPTCARNNIYNQVNAPGNPSPAGGGTPSIPPATGQWPPYTPQTFTGSTQTRRL